jgi:hypothetical protein
VSGSHISDKSPGNDPQRKKDMGSVPGTGGKMAERRLSIFDYKPHQSGTLVAIFTVRFEVLKLEIKGCTLHEKSGKKWIMLPSKAYEQDGVRKYNPICEISDLRYARQFQKSCLNAIDTYLKAPKKAGIL